MKMKKSSKDESEASLITKRLEHLGIIKVFRQHWLIPDDGFKNWAGFENWWNVRIAKNSTKWRSSIEYRALVKKQKEAKIRWANGKGEFSVIEDIGLEIVLKDPFYRFDWQIQRILINLGVSERFYDFVKGKLVTNDSPYKFAKSPKTEARITFNKTTGLNELWVRVWNETNASDLKSKVLWNRIKDLKKKLPDHSTIPDLEEYRLDIMSKLYEWHYVDGLTYKKVRERARNEFGLVVKSDVDLGKILQRYKEYMEPSTRKMKK